MLIPPINASGKFKFSTPFDQNLDEKEILKVVGVRTIHELQEALENPLENIYKINNLTEQDMLSDIDKNIPIIVFQLVSNKYYYVPASYINTIPLINGIIYQEKTFSINLGALPKDLDLSIMETDIISFIKSRLGITTEVTTINTSTEILIDEVTHNTFEQQRLAEVTDGDSCYTKLHKADIREIRNLGKIERLKCAVKYLENN